MFANHPGLSTAEATKRHRKFGPNILPEKPPPGNITLFLSQLKNPLIYVLLSAGIVTIITGHSSDAIIILLAVVINTILGFVQEKKATSALLALKHYVTSHVDVLRDGQRLSLDVSKVVPGDTVILNQGSKIPADGVLLSANRLYLDEAVLTGESLPVEKKANDSVYMGTTVSSGQAIMFVNSIGASTKMGAIALQIQESEELTPLQRQLSVFSRQLVVIIVILTIIVFLLGIFHGFSWLEVFSTSVALAVSSIPEGLIVSLTVVLAIGMQKILRRRGLVKKLAAAETLGGVTVICVDKTGTLTQGKMEVVDYVGDKKLLATQVTLANDLDDPLVISAFNWGKSILKDKLPNNLRLDSIPFSSKEKFFISLHQHDQKHNRVYVNGAPDVLLKWTNLSDAAKKKILATIDLHTQKGQRLIGFATKDIGSNKKTLETSDAKSGLTWIGLIAFSDPVRPSVKSALALSARAGIRTIVITGDYAKTSEFVLSELGIKLSPQEILTGDDLLNLDSEQLSQRVKSVKLFARTSPEQKLMIVESLKKNGEVVAMMGDGVNDAPALHRADVGIAMGEATDVAKESADLVILDSDFSTIIAAIEEGRVMFDNIRKIILYLMSDAFAEIFLIIGAMILGFPLPITAVLILWINIISDGFPGLSLSFDPKRSNIMEEGPRSPSEKLVNSWMTALIIFVSLVAATFTLLSFLFVYRSTGDLTMARSFVFITLGLDSLVYVFSVRTLMVPFWKTNMFENKWLILAVFIGLIFQYLPFLTEGTRQFFGLTSLGVTYWFVAFCLSIVMFLIIESLKYFYKKVAF
jgi:Ca2+-transporting ATPase